MAAQILPEPREDERAAILRALERLPGRRGGLHPAYASAWRRAGAQGAQRYLDSDSAAFPRRSRGATRA